MYLNPRQILILDIETRARDDAARLAPEPEAPSNYKDPAKIEAYRAEKRAEALARAPLDPGLCRISSVGLGRPRPDGGLDAEVLMVTDDEPLTLAGTWCNIRQASMVVGYNLLGFDLPVLLRRSMILGVPPGCYVDLRRYQNPPRGVIDLMQILSGWNARTCEGLAHVCASLGIEGIVGSGRDLAGMSPEEEAAHLAGDLAATWALFCRMNGVYWPRIDFARDAF